MDHGCVHENKVGGGGSGQGADWEASYQVMSHSNSFHFFARSLIAPPRHAPVRAPEMNEADARQYLSNDPHLLASLLMEMQGSARGSS